LMAGEEQPAQICSQLQDNAHIYLSELPYISIAEKHGNSVHVSR